MKFACIARKPRDIAAETIIEGRQYDNVNDAQAERMRLVSLYEDVTVLPIPGPTAIDWRTRSEEYA